MKRLFDAQAEQQRDLGVDPKHMDDQVRMDRTRRVLLGIHEEVVELQRITTPYKQHHLTVPVVNEENIADEIADVLKYLITLAQMFNIDDEGLRAAFARKTRVIQAKAKYDRLTLGHDDKVIAIDLDDVICDLSHWQEKLTRMKEGLPTGSTSLRTLEKFKDQFYRRGGFRDLDVIPGATAALVRMRDAGFKIIIVTARPAAQYKRIYADTLIWLDEHRIPHHKLIFNKDKVEALHNEVAPAWPRFFIEDHPKNALSLAAAGAPVLLFNQPHNENLVETENITRISGWTEALARIFPVEEADDQAAQAEYASSLRGE